MSKYSKWVSEVIFSESSRMEKVRKVVVKRKKGEGPGNQKGPDEREGKEERDHEENKHHMYTAKKI